jgi:4-hydroxy-tetrahydrodipicolinate reductase
MASSPIRVGVAGAAGKVGRAICDGVEAADDLVLAGRADPALDTPLSSILDDCDVVVDFTRPDVALGNAIACVEAGVHVVVGTTGFDVEALRERRGPGNAFVAPNFAIGAVLMMRFAVEASKHMAKAEIIELHHDAKLDAPSGTARRTAELMEGDVPVHSIRLPGLVAHQEVILGDVGQTLTIRHDSTDRTSFVPGVLLAVRRVADQGAPLVVGLEAFLFGDDAAA